MGFWLNHFCLSSFVLLETNRFRHYQRNSSICTMACPINCHCQWGVTGIFGGVFVLLCAFCFFAIRCLFKHFLEEIFQSDIYLYLCIFWAALGAFLLLCGITMECGGCTPKTSSRELQVDEETGKVTVPASYVMITA